MKLNKMKRLLNWIKRLHWTPFEETVIKYLNEFTTDKALRIICTETGTTVEVINAEDVSKLYEGKNFNNCAIHTRAVVKQPIV